MVRWKPLETNFQRRDPAESCVYHLTARDIPAKLRATMAAIGCRTRKELVARFRTRNPRSMCDIDPLHKWMQGRATPRHGAFYEEWRQLIGLERPSEWLVTCTLDAFLLDLSASSGIDEGRLRRSAAAAQTRPGVGAPTHGLLGGLASLGGSYRCYSRSFSPHFADHLIRGVLELEPGRSDLLGATYREKLPLGTLLMKGHAAISGRLLNIEVVDPDSGVKMVVISHVPGPPVTVLCGVLVAAAAISSEPLPSATLLLAVRVPAEGLADAAEGYVRLQPGAIAADLAAAGLTSDECAAVDARALDFLSPRALLVPQALQTGFADDLSGAFGGRTG